MAGTLIHCLLLRKQTFSSSAGSRFAVIVLTLFLVLLYFLIFVFVLFYVSMFI